MTTAAACPCARRAPYAALALLALALLLSPGTAAAQVNNDIFVMNANGTGQVDRTNNPANDIVPAWSPDGTKIAFVRDPGGIFVMNADGSGQTQLTSTAVSDLWPAWSPDGTKIAFDRLMTDSQDRVYRDIWVMNANGTGQTNVSNLTYPCSAGGPAWSPDGTKLAVARACGSSYGIWVMNANGTGTPAQVTSSPDGDGDADWSPDGTKIAFARCDGSGLFGCDGRNVFVTNANGSGTPTQLTFDGDGEYPSWSPDGTKIAYKGGGATGPYGIWVMNAADGSGKANLESNAGTEPDWSPGGTQQIAYVRRVEAAPQLTITNASVRECNSGTVPMTFTVSLSAPSSGAVSVHYATADGTASAPLDYQAAAGTLEFSPGQVSKTITVQVVCDTSDEPDESFFLNLSASTGATIADGVGVGTIINDDRKPVEQCQNGKDDDSDGTIDQQDPGCLNPKDDTYSAKDNNEGDENPRQLVLCGRRTISLVRADLKGKKVTLKGLVAVKYAGRKLTILAKAGKAFKKVKTVKSKADGSFSAKLKAPKERLVNKVRYRASVAGKGSVALKLPQSLASSSIKQKGDTITLRGKVKRPLLGRKRNRVTVKRLVCGHYTTVGQAKPNKKGAYTIRFKAPAFARAALYRAETKVLRKPGSKKYVKQYARAISITIKGETG